jgi:coproporphyrinogen III oxidase
MDMAVIEDRKTRARAWFERLRDDICVAFEALEDEAPTSIPATPDASSARAGTAPIIPASPAAAA